MGLRVTLLAGGTGGTKLAHGFALIGPDVELTVIANVGDDLEIHGLHVSPDVDTLLYTLSGLVDTERGWGIHGDTLSAHEMFARLGQPTWFTVGDADLATHVHRTHLLRAGASLTDATAALAAALGIGARILPATNDRLRTRLETDAGLLEFQDYFVRLRQEPTVTGVRLDGVEDARPTDAVLAAIASAELIVIGPSNPFVSIGPILELRGRSRSAGGGIGAEGRRQPDRGRPGAEGPGGPDARRRWATSRAPWVWRGSMPGWSIGSSSTPPTPSCEPRSRASGCRSRSCRR